MIITLAKLKERDACLDAICEFEQAVGKQTANIEWNEAAQGWVLASPWRTWLGWAWRNHILPMWSMSGADLSRADLSRADLSRADLSRADLSRADLNEANLRGADLSWANLRGADLYEANLRGAYLSLAEWNKYTIWPVGFSEGKITD
jgi:hypothetical protein